MPLIDMSQGDLLFPEPQLYEISLNIREIGLQQSFVTVDVILVSSARFATLYKRHLDPPYYSSIPPRLSFALKAFVERTDNLSSCPTNNTATN
jgi:hypothetical protein